MPPDWFDWVKQAEKLFDQKQYDEAAILAERVLQANPLCAQAHQVAGMVLSERGKYREAIVRITRGLSLPPDMVPSHNALGRCQFLLGNLDEASHPYPHGPGLAARSRLCPFQSGHDLAQARETITKAGRNTNGAGRATWCSGRPYLGRAGTGRRCKGGPSWSIPNRASATCSSSCGCCPNSNAWAAGSSLPVRRHAHLAQAAQLHRRLVPHRRAGPDQLRHLYALAQLAWLARHQRREHAADGSVCFRRSQAHRAWQPCIQNLPPYPTLSPSGGGVGSRSACAGKAVRRSRTTSSARFRWPRSPPGPVPGVTFVSLQKGPGEEQIEPNRAALPLQVISDLDRDATFVDTAAILQHLDLLITSDTATAHLAGALGRPVWVLVSVGGDWRWLTNRSDSPWYPSMRLFRQKVFADWTGS